MAGDGDKRNRIIDRGGVQISTRPGGSPHTAMPFRVYLVPPLRVEPVYANPVPPPPSDHIILLVCVYFLATIIKHFLNLNLPINYYKIYS